MFKNMKIYVLMIREIEEYNNICVTTDINEIKLCLTVELHSTKFMLEIWEDEELIKYVSGNEILEFIAEQQKMPERHK